MTEASFCFRYLAYFCYHDFPFSPAPWARGTRWVESARRRGSPVGVPSLPPLAGSPEAWSATQGVRFHVPLSLTLISLSRGQQIPFIFGVNCFPILDQATSGVGRGGESQLDPTPPRPAPLPPPSHRPAMVILSFTSLQLQGRSPDTKGWLHRSLNLSHYSRHPQRLSGD